MATGEHPRSGSSTRHCSRCSCCCSRGLYMFVLPYAAKWRGAVNTSLAKHGDSARDRSAAKPVLLSAAIRRSRRATATPPCRPTSRPCRAGNATSGARLDALIVRTVPGVRKAGQMGTRRSIGVEDQGWFLAFHCFTKYVKVAFFRGTSLRPVPPGASAQGQGRARLTTPQSRQRRRSARSRPEGDNIAWPMCMPAEAQRLSANDDNHEESDNDHEEEQERRDESERRRPLPPG